MDEYKVPDLIGEPIQAWRCWFVVPENKTSGPLRLASVVYGDLWEPKKEHKARCRPAESASEGWHDPPARTHGCGIYGVKTQEQVNRYYRSGEYRSRFEYTEIYRVIGLVALWGKIVPGEKGYRAEYAYPIKLQVAKKIKGRDWHLSPQEVANNLEEYGCEVELTDEEFILTTSPLKDLMRKKYG